MRLTYGLTHDSVTTLRVKRLWTLCESGTLFSIFHPVGHTLKLVLKAVGICGRGGGRREAYGVTVYRPVVRRTL